MENKSELIGKTIQCLDKGFVRLIDYMGDDNAIVQSARVSYGDGTKSINEDRGLIRYLMRHFHTTPFEMVEIKFHCKLPIFIARQWIRHRTANVNEYSGRYSIMKEEFYVPSLENVNFQSKSNKQGRDTDENISLNTKENVIQQIVEEQKKSYSNYENFLEQDIAREIARINLPLSLYTEWYWKIDLHNLFHFLRLRLDSHSQYEIRVYANAIAEITKQIVPIAYESFEDYILNSEKFSHNELKILKQFLDLQNVSVSKLIENGLSKREVEEFLSKLSKISNL